MNPNNEVPRPPHDYLREIAQDHGAIEMVDSEMFFGLLCLGESISAIERKCLSEYDLSPSRLAVMILLGIDEAVTRRPAELARAIGFTRATMTGLLDTLEDAGYIQRALDPEDRRSFLVTSTPACREALKRILPEYSRMVSTVASAFATGEQEGFRHFVLKLQANFALNWAKGSVPPVGNDTSATTPVGNHPWAATNGPTNRVDGLPVAYVCEKSENGSSHSVAKETEREFQESGVLNQR